MSSRILQRVIMFSCIVVLVSIIFAGCGSATLDEYEQEVTALNELAAEKMAEVSEALAGGAHEDEESHEDETEGPTGEDGSSEDDESHEDGTEGSTAEDGSSEDEGSHESEGEAVEVLVGALEEAIGSLKTVILELEDVKVPGGMEDFHHALLLFYQSNLSTYEALLATLEPVEAHGEENAPHDEGETAEHEEDSEESHGEDTSHDEETSGGGH